MSFQVKIEKNNFNVIIKIKKDIVFTKTISIYDEIVVNFFDGNIHYFYDFLENMEYTIEEKRDEIIFSNKSPPFFKFILKPEINLTNELLKKDCEINSLKNEIQKLHIELNKCKSDIKKLTDKYGDFTPVEDYSNYPYCNYHLKKLSLKDKILLK